MCDIEGGISPKTEVGAEFSHVIYAQRLCGRNMPGMQRNPGWMEQSNPRGCKGWFTDPIGFVDHSKAFSSYPG